MANHTGYVYIAPNGMYLTRNTYIGHSYTWVMGLTVHLDAAELFATEGLISGGEAYNWGPVNEALNACNAEASIEQLHPLPAVSKQQVLIGHHNEE